MVRSWEKSKALLERAKGSLAGGVSSPFRAKAPVPLYYESGCGARLRDVDGNEYIDYQLAWGPMILGYAHPRIVEAIRRAAEKPLTYGAQHEHEIAVAERIQQIVPCAERVAFCSSGSEAVHLAHRLARAFTRRPLIIKFEGHYHGWLDSALISNHPGPADVGPLEAPHTVLHSAGQVPSAAENTVVAPWNRIDLLEQILRAHGDRVAAVIMEPVLCNSGCILPEDGYLGAVKALCERQGALLIFDEVITGFRMALGGAQSFYGVTPDMATFGKAAAAGGVLSVVAGRKEILEMMFGGGVAFGGTFNGNALSLAAADAALTELARENGAALHHANRMGRKLMEGIRAMAPEGTTVCGFGTAFAVHFTPRKELRQYRDTFEDDPKMLREFLLGALERGVNLVPDGRFYTSCAHTEADINQTLDALRDTFATLGSR